MKFEYKYLLILALVLIAGCGGGGGSDKTASSSLVTIDSTSKARNAYYLIGENNSNVYSIAGWLENVLSEINKVSFDPSKAPAYGLYKAYEISCPTQGKMILNGKISLNGETNYILDIVLQDCYFDGTNLDGKIGLTGTVNQDKSVSIQADMDHLLIGKGMSQESTADAIMTIKNSSSIDKIYQLKLNGTILNSNIEINYVDYNIAIRQNSQGEASLVKGDFEVVQSTSFCAQGKYQVTTPIPLTESGKLQINNAIVEINNDHSVYIQYDEGNTTANNVTVLSCS